jgi:DNA-binding protein HU-beta
VNKSELIDVVSKTTLLTKREADEAVNALIHAVASEVKAGRRVVVAGFGSFNPTHRGARMGRNPQTGAPVAIAASRGLRFAASAMLKDILNEKVPLPELKPPAPATRAAKAGKSTRPTSKAKKAPKKAPKKAAKKGKKAPKKAAKKARKRTPAKKAVKRAAKGSARKIVRRIPARKAAKRAPARKAAKRSARKAVKRVPARASSKRAPARKAAKRSARRP